MTLTVCELFAGAGGAALGLRDAGFTCVWAGEMDAHACQTFRAAFPGVPLHEGKLTGEETLPSWLDLIAGGPSCQPFSGAGIGLGQYDKRDAFPAFIGLVRSARPRAFLFENVKGLTAPKHRPYLDRIIGELHALGYTTHERVLNCADYGVPQRRERVFVVGFLDAATPWSWPEPTHSQATLVKAKWIDGSYWREHRLASSIAYDRETGAHQSDIPAATLLNGTDGFHTGGPEPTRRLVIGSGVTGVSKTEARILRKLKDNDPATVKASMLLRHRTVRDTLAPMWAAGLVEGVPIDQARVAKIAEQKKKNGLALTDDIDAAARTVDAKQGSGDARTSEIVIACRRGREGGSRMESTSIDETSVALRSSAGGSSVPFLAPKPCETTPEWLAKHPPATPDETSPTVRTGHRDAETLTLAIASRIASGEVDHILRKHPPQVLDSSSTIEANISRGGYYGLIDTATVRNLGAGDGPGATLDESCVTIPAVAGGQTGVVFAGAGEHKYADANGRVHSRPATTLRRLSWAECSVLQGFPVDHPFAGPKTAIYRQVGNACPPLMVEVLGRQLAKVLQRNDEPEIFTW